MWPDQLGERQSWGSQAQVTLLPASSHGPRTCCAAQGPGARSPGKWHTLMKVGPGAGDVKREVEEVMNVVRLGGWHATGRRKLACDRKEEVRMLL